MAELKVKDEALEALVGQKTEKGQKSAKEEKETVVIPTEEEEDETLSSVVELSRKYEFDGRTIESIDLSGLEDITGAEATKIEKIYRTLTKTYSSQPQLTPEYAMAAASYVTDLPVEFFKYLKIKDVTKIQLRVINFFYSD